MKKEYFFIAVLLALALLACSKKDNINSNNPPSDEPPQTDPTITTLASGLMNIAGIAVDANSVYWTESKDGTIPPFQGTTYVKKVGLNGGTISILASDSGQPNYVNTWSIAIDQNSVYWTQSNQNIATLKKVGLNGGAVTSLVSGLPNSLTLSSTSIYYTDAGLGFGFSLVNKVGFNGGPTANLASALNEPWGIVADANNVYWISAWDGIIRKVGVNGGSVTTLAQTSGAAAYRNDIMAIDAVNLFFIDMPDSGAIKKIGLSGGIITTIATSNSPVGLALDANNVYWTDQTGFIKKVSKNGGTVTSFHVTGSPSYITLDSQYIYWTDGSSIKKALK